MGLIWNSAGRPRLAADGEQPWVVCSWCDADNSVHYDCGLYDDESDTLVVDCEEFAFSTPFGEYWQWAYIEGTA